MEILEIGASERERDRETVCVYIMALSPQRTFQNILILLGSQLTFLSFIYVFIFNLKSPFKVWVLGVELRTQMVRIGSKCLHPLSFC